MFKRLELFKNREYYLMLLPAAVIFFLFAYLPMPGIIIAFKNYNFKDGIFHSPFVGFDNFKFFFASIYASRTTFNTLWINFNNILWGTVVAVVLAIAINEIRCSLAKRLHQSFLFLPYFFSTIVVANFVQLIFASKEGIVNQILRATGISPVEWYMDPKPWVVILVCVYIWKNAGYAIIIYMGTITGIDEEIYEAARIDGAKRLQQIKYITIPYLIPTVIIMTLLAIGRVFFGDFQLIYSIIQDSGIIMPKTDVIETFVFRAVRQTSDFSLGTAVGLYQSLVGFVLVLASNYIVKLYNKEYTLF